MRRTVPTLAALALLTLAPTARSGPIAEQVVTPSVTVVAGGWCGSGTVIRHEGKVRVLTAAHVLEKQPPDEGAAVRARVGGKDAERPCAIVRYDRLADLALLEPEDPTGLIPASLGLDLPELEPGEDAWYCGCGGGLGWNLQKTIVNQDDGEWTTVNGGGWYGHSGSGCFVRRGDRLVLVGVVVELHNPRSPKSPLRCVTRARIKAFLGAGYESNAPRMDKVP